MRAQEHITSGACVLFALLIVPMPCSGGRFLNSPYHASVSYRIGAVVGVGC
jgi:hypothetical protein